MASNRRVRRKQCQNKRAYSCWAAAKAELARLFAKGEAGLHIYPCAFARHLHIGHLRGARTDEQIKYHERTRRGLV